MRAGSALSAFSDTAGNQYDVGDKVPDGVQIVLNKEQWNKAWTYSRQISPDNFTRDDATETYKPHDYVLKHFVQQLPDKYSFMCHCETNALMGVTERSDDATLYIPMPSCDQCALLMINHPFVKVARIVYYENRAYPQHLYDAAGIRVEQYDAETHGHPDEWLLIAAQHSRLRRTGSATLSKSSRMSYAPNR
jgi:deoxycytidylate deaminase